MNILIAGGGTGGHIIPALAIARELRDQHSAHIRFVGTARGLETRLVPEAGFALDLIHVGQLKNVSLATRLRTLADLPLGILRCLSLLRTFKPAVVIGVGGYASGPAMMAALLLRIPTLAFEPNAVPGLANRLVGKQVSAAAVNFTETTRFFRNATVTGIPVRPEFFAIPEKVSGPLRLLVFGGSQGARILNEVLPQIAADLLARFPSLTILHQAGARQFDATRARYTPLLLAEPRLRVVPYLDAIVSEIAAADLILCRSGASTVAELAAAGRPSVLVPFAAAADDHQRKNAEAFLQVGAAVMILEFDFIPERILTELSYLLDDPAPRHRMAQAARTLAHPAAAAQIARMAIALARV
jgi:UDP-N-acetylglucosamine--N-acetylmuramyl-(pentapeptide) pyrophosphoryl-undecaprenol N-acetylglucosamine transferase